MLLKRLELQGFKSFADKTVFDLDTPVSAIVGPNGSGKSNVTDAIRWLLGEREARHLRGAKVEDLIFAGTEKKPRLGQAQATLYFDNTSHYFPVEYEEVSVSRKVSRDGESLYFINKSEVRLKDIIDFFARSKVGARGLTIITQGSSDMFIKATPEERREMVEEILGLKEYQIKKTDAERKLKSTYENLDKVGALIEEIKPHLRFLKKQVSRYESRKEFLDELAKLENSFYGKRYKTFKYELENYQSKVAKLNGEVEHEEKIYKELERGLDKVRTSEPSDLSQAPTKVGEDNKVKLMARRAEIERELGKIEARLEFRAKQGEASGVDFAAILKEIRAAAEELVHANDIELIRAKLKGIVGQIDKAFGTEAKNVDSELLEAQKKLSRELAALDKEIRALAKTEDEERARLSSFNKDFTEAYEKAETQRKKLEGLVGDRQQVKFSIEKAELQISNLEEELRQIGRTLDSLQVLDDRYVINLDMTDDAAIKRMYKLRGELAGIGELDENLIKEANETEERHNFLTSQVEDLKKAIHDLKSLIKELDGKIHHDFTEALHKINEELQKLMTVMFGGGRAKLVVKQLNNNITNNGVTEEQNNKEVLEEETKIGIEIDLTLPKKRLKGLDVLSGGERALVSIAVLFSLISVSPPPFLVLDEVDAALDEANAKRCADIIKEMSKKTQFVLVTHNRATMEAADFLYGVTMGADGVSRVLSLKLEAAKEAVAA